MAKTNSKAKQLTEKEPVPAPADAIPEVPTVSVPAVPSTPQTSANLNEWFREQFEVTAILKAAITLGILGFIPGAWMIGLPLLTVYGLIKREKVAEAIRRFFSFRKELQTENVAQTTGEKIADFLITYYAGILRWFATLILFFTMPVGFGIFAAYGLFRFTTAQWLDIFQERCKDIYKFVQGGIGRFIRDASFNTQLALGLVVSLLIGGSILMSGGGVLFAYSIAVCQLAAVLVGATALGRDLLFALNNPGIALTKNAGKIAGAFWGHWLAYKVFAGQLTGSMGPTVGYVQNYSLFSGLISSFLSPSGWFIFNSGGILGVIGSWFMSFFNNIFFKMFVTESIQMQGDFFGVISPSVLQLVGTIVACTLAGALVHQFVDSLWNELASDSKKVATASVKGVKAANTRLVDGLYQTKWALGFIACATPILISHATTGAAILELAGGSLLAASAMTVAGLATAIGAIYGIGYGLRAIASQILAKREAAITQAAANSTPVVTEPVGKKPAVSNVIPLVTESVGKRPIGKAPATTKTTGKKAKPIVTAFEKSKASAPAEKTQEQPLRRSSRLNK